MTIDPASKKQILADPVAVYVSLHTVTNEQDIDTLAKLRRQYRELKEQGEETSEISRGLSRNIGIAKRKGEPVESLMQSMQEMSARLKITMKQLADIEDRILVYFTAGEQEPVQGNAQTPAVDRKEPASAVVRDEDISISQLGTELDEWNAYVEDNPQASIYHRAEWRELIRKSFGHEGIYFIARDKRRNIVGTLPLVRLKSRLFGDFLVSMPYFNYGGAIADHEDIRLKLVNSANEHAAGLGVTHVEYRDCIPHEGMAADTRKSNLLLELPESADELWAGFPSKLRSQIKRPMREDPAVFDGGAEYLDDFYSVFARNMRDLGTPVYSKSFFANILECFPDAGRILIVRMSGMPVAAGFLLGYKDRLEIPWASTLREVNHLSVNMLLYWEVLKLAVRMGYRRFDFGRSSKDSGTYRFKCQWGARPEQSYWHYWLNTGQGMPSLNPDNPKYALAIRLWKHLPLALTNRLGPRIVRNLP